MALVQISDVVVPRIFTGYTQQITEEKTRIITAGAMVTDQQLSDMLAGGGLTFDAPSWKDLANDEDNVSSDDAAGANDSTPKKTGTADEVAVRLNRNQSWSTADLTSALAGSDPAQSIANRVGDYWARRLQACFVATMKGVFADNDAAPTGTEHVQGDLTFDISGVSYTEGVTDFSAESFINATLTMGDSMESLGIVMMHSVVYGRAQKNNLIDFIPDANGDITIPTVLGRRVVIDDGLPAAGGVYQTWLFGPGAVRFGRADPKVPTAVDRKEEAGNGGGEERLYNRVQWCIHPVGHKYAGTTSKGGPSNAATSNNLAHAGSWARVYTERKQIKIARLITREA